MPRTNINVTKVTRTGVSIATGSAVDVANGNTIANDGKVAVLVKNTGSTSHTLTIAIAEKVDGQTVPAKTWTVAASAQLAIGPFDPSVYGGRLQVNGDNAELTVLPVRIS